MVTIVDNTIMIKKKTRILVTSGGRLESCGIFVQVPQVLRRVSDPPFDVVRIELLDSGNRCLERI